MYIEKASRNIQVQEGAQRIEQLFLECYLNPGISTKELARRTFLPPPVAAAIKRELIKAGALVQDRGVRCTREGAAWIEREWGYRGLDQRLHRSLQAENAWTEELQEVLALLEELFSGRPAANVLIDQSKCTPETSLRRALLCLKQHALIGKRILCVGDDDLVSISIGLLLRRLFPGKSHTATQIDVVDIDERFLRYIEQLAARHGLPIRCRRQDLKDPLPEELQGKFDCFFTDPPYTLQGMSLFISRGIQGLKREKGLPVFLSFAHKSPAVMLAMQREFVGMGLTVGANFPGFNAYEAAEMIANRSQMFILRTTDQTEPACKESFNDALYTGEVKRTLRTYRCKQCRYETQVGMTGAYATIEELKNAGCRDCGGDRFDMTDKRDVPQEPKDAAQDKQN